MGQIINKEEVFKYLDGLRARGVQMGSAARHLVQKFGLDYSPAKDLLYEWMEEAQ